MHREFKLIRKSISEYLNYIIPKSIVLGSLPPQVVDNHDRDNNAPQFKHNDAKVALISSSKAVINVSVRDL